jgi:hypothetical protein
MTDNRIPGAQEDNLTARIESRTSKFPSTTFLALAGGAIAASAALRAVNKPDWALFVGQWTAPFLLLGIYNKMVKQHGSDAISRTGTAEI